MRLIDNYSDFFDSVARCPISKERLKKDDSTLISDVGFRYEGGDLRVGLEYSEEWREGQEDYERYHSRWIKGDYKQYTADDHQLQVIYEAMGMGGSVLDVGGGLGLVAQQAVLDPKTYVSLDAMPSRWADIDQSSAFASHYASCAKLCRVPAYAEFLPIASGTFDCVHMRSCLDHFANPLLALQEAYRVLKPDGVLVVGLSLEGAYKKGERGLYPKLKIMVKETAWARELYERFFDHHMFHPTKEGVCALLSKAGFRVEREAWQQGYHNVLYVRACKHQLRNTTVIPC